MAGQRIPLNSAEAEDIGVVLARRALRDTGSLQAAGAGGRSMVWPSLREQRAVPRADSRRAGLFGGGAERLLGSTDVVLSFGGAPAAAGGSQSGRRWTIWGQGDLQTFRGAPEAPDSALPAAYDGELRTAYVGVDARLSERWLTGLAVARSFGAGAWRAGAASGEIETALTAVHPYVRWSSGNTTIWALSGFGRGEATNVRAINGAEETSGLGLGLVEARRGLAVVSGGVQLGLRGELSWARLTSGDGGETLHGMRADVRRVRVGVEATREWSGPGGMTVAPFGKVSTRHDGGAGQTGFGLEVEGGGRLTAGLLRVEAQGRMLVLHTAAGYKERGASVTVSVGEGARRPGLTLSVAPRWGASGSADALWQDQIYQRFGYGPRPDDGALEARLSYGWRMPGRLLLAPFGSHGYGHGSRRFQLGAALGALDTAAGSPLQIEFSGERYRRRTGETDLRINLLGVVAFGGRSTQAIDPLSAQ